MLQFNGKRTEVFAFMTERVSERAYAKINPYLDIISRRTDGFHEIVSYMLTLDLCDKIEITRKESGISVKGNAGVPEKEDLMYRAAEMFFAETGIDGGAFINIEKVIPMQAGLAGGSSDAAAVLRGLDRLYKTGMCTHDLEVIGGRLGSDVPFCIGGGARISRGRGEILSDAPKFPDCRVVVAIGKERASTPRRFALLDRLFDNFSERIYDADRFADFCDSAGKGDLFTTVEYMYNIFEATGCRDEAAIGIMKDKGAVGCLMSGSGSAVFGIFDDSNTSHRACAALIDAEYTAFDTSPIYNFKA